MTELETVAHIRKRPRMYMAQLGHKGLVSTLTSIFRFYILEHSSNSIQFEIHGYSDAVIRVCSIDKPLKDNWGVWLESELPFHNSYALLALNALCEYFTISFFDEKGVFKSEHYEKGRLTKGKKSAHQVECNEIEIKFKLDSTFWGDTFSWNHEYIYNEIRNYAYQHPQVKFKLIQELKNGQNSSNFHFKNGLLDKLNTEKLKLWGDYGATMSLHIKTNSYSLVAALSIGNSWPEHSVIQTSVNHFDTIENGSHLDALLIGLENGLKRHIKELNLTPMSGDFSKTLLSDLFGLINLNMDDERWHGPTKSKLDCPEVVEPIAEAVAQKVYEFLSSEEYPEMALRAYVDHFPNTD